MTSQEISALYHPATRWDLYWVPGRVVYFDVAAAAARAIHLKQAVNRASTY